MGVEKFWRRNGWRSVHRRCFDNNCLRRGRGNLCHESRACASGGTPRNRGSRFYCGVGLTQS